MSLIISVLLWLGIISSGNTYTTSTINQLGSANGGAVQQVSSDPILHQFVITNHCHTQVVITHDEDNNGDR